ncbi:MAG: gliding motility-associated C-terminal domain-containing protein, partial [Bacteroidetes bacterium]|nr:gliding motility-associated C-terminal domain-containing protein [Bacteroidota bacterium]
GNGGSPPYQYSINNQVYFQGNEFHNLSPGNYICWIKDGKGCGATVNTVIQLLNTLNTDAGNDKTICEGDAVTMTAASNGDSFSWIPSSFLSNSSVLNPVASPLVTTEYILKSVKGICTLSDTVLVRVNAAPVAFPGQDETICFGQDASLSGSGGVEYKWSPATYLSNSLIRNPVVFSPDATIVYSLLVKDANGCTSLNNAQVTINVTPPAQIFAGKDTVITMGQPYQLTAQDINNSGFVSYSWSPPFGLDNNRIKNPIATINSETTYTVTAVTSAGCRGSDDIVLKVYKGPEIYVPSAFTPNNDGRNDILRVMPVGLKEFHYFKIFNRWGQVVFSTKDPSVGWNGNVKTAIPETGVYIWVAEGIDGQGNK